MAISFPDNINLGVGNPIDAKYLNSLNAPYASLAAVKSAIVLSQRYVGLTVLVTTGGTNYEYWFKQGVADGDLVLKTAPTSGGTGGGTITGATNGLSVSGKNIKLGGVLTGDTNIDINNQILSFSGATSCSFFSDVCTQIGSGGLGVLFQCVNDSAAIYTSNGGTICLEGINDTISLCSTNGANVVIDAISDNITLYTNNGASIELIGANDTASIYSNAGSVLCLNDGNTGGAILTSTGTSYVCVALTNIELATDVVKINGTISGGTPSDSILVWNSSDKEIKTISSAEAVVFAITGATNGLTKIGLHDIALGGTLTGDTTFSGGILKYGISPLFTDGTQIVDKGYVDSVASGLFPKQAVRVATTVNRVLSGLTAVDGITPNNGDRVLVKNQIIGSANGIYIASASTWTRAADMDFSPSGETVSGSYSWVLTGVTNGHTAWVLTTPDPIASGDTLTFVLFSQISDIVGGTGIDVVLSGTTTVISLDNTTQSVINLAITGATNGLCKYNAHNVCLGGALVANTSIQGANTYCLCLGTFASRLDCLGGYACNQICFEALCGSCSGGLFLTPSEAQMQGSCDLRTAFIDTNGGAVALWSESGSSCNFLNISEKCMIIGGTPGFKGAEYALDYSTSYSLRSLVDKEYVDSKVSGATSGSTVLADGILKWTGNTFNPYSAAIAGKLYSGTTRPTDRTTSLKYNGNFNSTNLFASGFTTQLGDCAGVNAVCMVQQTAVGRQAGSSNSGCTQTAVGYGAGTANKCCDQVAVGCNAGVSNRGVAQIAIGTATGFNNSGLAQIAIGCNSGCNNSGSTQTAIGNCAGVCNRSDCQVAIGFLAGLCNRNSSQVAIGTCAGQCNTGIAQVTIGNIAGLCNTGANQVSIGVNAGDFNKGLCQVAIGSQAGCRNSGNTQIAIGLCAGACNKCIWQIAIGDCAGYFSSGSTQIAIGTRAGYCNKGGNQIAIGYQASFCDKSGGQTIAIGCDAGNLNCGSLQMAIGSGAGYQNCGDRQMAIGETSGQYNKGNCTVSIGESSGIFNSGHTQIAIGYSAGNNNKCDNQITIGCFAGSGNKGVNQVAIGCQSGYQNTGLQQLALGGAAGYTNIGAQQIALGCFSGYFNSGSTQVAIGFCAGCGNKCCGQVAMGYGSGSGNRGADQIAIGTLAGCLNKSGNQIAIGCLSAGNNSGSTQIAIGISAGAFNRCSDQVAIGSAAGYCNKGACQVAIGYWGGRDACDNDCQVAIGVHAGYRSTGSTQVAVGTCAGECNKCSCQVAIGTCAGLCNVGILQLAIGYKAGSFNCGGDQLAIGCSAGVNNKGNDQNVIGQFAGQCNFGTSQIGIGNNAGICNIGANQIAIGTVTGCKNSGTTQIAIGHQAGLNNKCDFEIAIGSSSGKDNRGNCLIAIGAGAGCLNTGSNVIAIGNCAGSGNTLSNRFILKHSSTCSLMEGDFSTGDVYMRCLTLSSLSGTTGGDVGVNAAGKLTRGVTGGTLIKTVCNMTTPTYSVKQTDFYIGTSGGSTVTLLPNVNGAAINGMVVTIADVAGNASPACYVQISGAFFGGSIVACIDTAYGAISFLYNGGKTCWGAIAFSQSLVV